jgi:hypothetical protein
MYCTSCGSQLTPGAHRCPMCGLPTYAAPTNGATPLYEHTVSSSPAYGSDAGTSYASIPTSQDPYNMPPPPPPPPSYTPPPPPIGARRHPAALIILLLALTTLLVLGSGLLYYMAAYQPRRLHSQASTATAHTQARATAAQRDPYGFAGTLAFVDPLSSNSRGYGWDENANCVFTKGMYHAIAPDTRYSDYCTASTSNFSDFAFEVQMTILRGNAGGVIFRAHNVKQNKYYDYHIGQDGSYAFEAVNGSASPTLKQGSSPAIKQGPKRTNLIAVVADGARITLYVNHYSLGSIDDATFSMGQIGVYAVVYAQPTEVAFSNAKVWSLPSGL